MPSYVIKMSEYVVYEIEVEAESIEEALSLAKEDPYSFHNLNETYCEREFEAQS